jgi:hypothetical protein
MSKFVWCHSIAGQFGEVPTAKYVRNVAAARDLVQVSHMCPATSVTVSVGQNIESTTNQAQSQTNIHWVRMGSLMT